MPKIRIIRPRELEVDDPPDLNSFFPCMVAEGDSWFTLGSIPDMNLLQELEFEARGAVVNLAYPGDEASAMRKALGASGTRRVDVWASQFGAFVADRAAYPYQAILLSAGGNDLISAVPHLLRRGIDYGAIDPAQPRDLVDADRLAQFDAFLKANLTGIVEFVREHGGPNRDTPIFTHTYDYPTPNDAPATILGARVGSSWLFPRLTEAALPTSHWVTLTDFLLDHLAGLLTSLDLPDFHVVRTLGTIERAALGATGDSGDWDNEIHPNRRGYHKLAAKLARKIKTELGLPSPGRPVDG
jgi:lysophospholipase L1-like esterase